MLAKCKSISESICAPSVVSAFLSRSNKQQAKVHVTGSKVNRGGGYGLEIQCKNTFHDHGQKITWISSRLKQL